MSELTWNGNKGFVTGMETFVIEERGLGEKYPYTVRCLIPSLATSSFAFGFPFEHKDECKEAAKNALIQWLLQSTQSGETEYSLPA